MTARRIGCASVIALALGGALAFPTSASAAENDAATSLSGSFLAGHVAQKRRDLPAAVKYITRALAQDSSQPDLVRRGFLFSIMDGRLDEGFALAETYIEKEQRGAVASLALAIRDIKNGDWAAADSRMADLDAAGLSAFTVPAIRAWAAFTASGKDAGIAALAPLRETRGTQTLYSLHVGLMHELSGENAAAETYYLNVAEEGGGASLRSARFLGTLYERQGKFEEAKAAYDLYLQEQPNTGFLDADFNRLANKGDAPQLVASAEDGVAEALFGIASSLNQQGGRETALVLSRLALHLRPDFPIMQFTIGGILEQLERDEDAINVYVDIGADTPFSMASKVSTAHALNRLERKDEAVALLNDLSAAYPDDEGPDIALGDILRRHREWDAAIDAYDRAFERIGEPEARHWQLLYTRGIVLERGKQWDRAEADFLKALEFEPDQPLVLNYLGYSWVEQGRNLDQALEMIKTAVAKRPHDGYITDSLGWVYYRLGRYEEAVPELERAVELRPEDPVINDHLGDAYYKVGRRLEATFQWNRALSLDPEPEDKESIERKLKDGLIEEAGTVTKTNTNGG